MLCRLLFRGMPRQEVIDVDEEPPKKNSRTELTECQVCHMRYVPVCGTNCPFCALRPSPEKRQCAICLAFVPSRVVLCPWCRLVDMAPSEPDDDDDDDDECDDEESMDDDGGDDGDVGSGADE